MATELRVFSPSSTETFAKCPRKWALNREGWKPRIIQYPELCAVLGDGFAASMERLNTLFINGVALIPVAEVIEAGNVVMRERLDRDLEAGRRIHEKDLNFSDLLPLKLDQAVRLYLQANPLKDWKILQTEKTYEDHGYARIDLLAEDSLGPAVFDYKVKVKLDKKWEDAEFEKFGRSQQRFHYQWAAGVKRFFIILVVLGPKPYVKLSPPFGDSKYFDSGLWLADSQGVWQHMGFLKDAIEQYGDKLHIDGAPTHADQYGPCEFEEACLTHALDPAAMSIEYVKVERKRSYGTSDNANKDSGLKDGGTGEVVRT